MQMNPIENGPGANRVLESLYPNLTELTALDVKTYGSETADIASLAIVPFGVAGPAKDMLAFEFRSELQRPQAYGDDDSPTFAQQRDDLMGALNGSQVIVVHGDSSARILKTRLPNWQPNMVLCTERLGRVATPHENSHKLASLVFSLRLDEKYPLHDYGPAQDCRYRSVAIGYLYLEMLNAIKEHGYTEGNIEFAAKVRNL